MILTDKQKEYVQKANKRWNVKVGGTGTGKTFIDYTYIIPQRTRDFKDVEGLYLLVGVTTATIERNVLEPMRERYGEGLVGYINKGAGTVRLFGEVYHVIGAEKENATNKIQGMTVKYAYGDEFVNWNETFFKMLTTRMRASGAMVDLTGNPSHPYHWAKKFIDKMIENDRLFYQHSMIDDNPTLDDDFVESQKIELKGTTEYKRLILGQWASAEGGVYPMFTDNLVIPTKDWETHEIRKKSGFVSIGVDFGGNQSKHAFNATYVTHDYSKIVTVKDHAFKPTTPKELDREFIRFIQEILDEGYTIQEIRADSAEQVLIRGLRKALQKEKLFYSIRNAIKGEINERINVYQRLMNTQRYFILDRCKSTIEAFDNALWADKLKQGKDERLDDGTTNIDSLDAQEYSTERHHNNLLRR